MKVIEYNCTCKKPQDWNCKECKENIKLLTNYSNE